MHQMQKANIWLRGLFTQQIQTWLWTTHPWGELREAAQSGQSGTRPWLTPAKFWSHDSRQWLMPCGSSSFLGLTGVVTHTLGCLCLFLISLR